MKMWIFKWMKKSDNLPNFSQHLNECWNKDEGLMKINQNFGGLVLWELELDPDFFLNLVSIIGFKEFFL